MISRDKKFPTLVGGVGDFDSDCRYKTEQRSKTNREILFINKDSQKCSLGRKSDRHESYKSAKFYSVCIEGLITRKNHHEHFI